VAGIKRLWAISPSQLSSLSSSGFHCRQLQLGTGRSQSRIPLKASRASSTHLSGVFLPMIPAGPLSTMEKSRPPSVTAAATLTSSSCDRQYRGPQSQRSVRGGPTRLSFATALFPGLCRKCVQSSISFGRALTLFFPPARTVPPGARTRSTSPLSVDTPSAITRRFTNSSPYGNVPPCHLLAVTRPWIPAERALSRNAETLPASVSRNCTMNDGGTSFSESGFAASAPTMTTSPPLSPDDLMMSARPAAASVIEM